MWQKTVLNIAEEFQKYKDLMDWQKKEFKKQLQREVSASWSFFYIYIYIYIDQGNNILN